MLQPFAAAYYALKHRKNISDLAVSDLDSAEHLWGGPDYSKAFRNVLVGAPESRGEVWHAWISSGDVELAEDRAYYVLRHRSEVAGETLDRWALYCALDINDPSLFIHEDVLPEGVERARQATEACETDMAPIFVGCDESLSADLRGWLEASVQGKIPLLTYEENEKSTHEIWAIEGNGSVESLRPLFENAPLFLLDGHHRLAAAKENHRIGMGDGNILACVCSMGPSDTLILPIHRTVHYERWMIPDALFGDLVRSGCRVTELSDLKVSGIPEFLETHESSSPFCLVVHSYSSKPYLVHLPISSALAPELASLPVACLDYGVMSQHPQATAIPIASFDSALEQLALDQAQAAFFLPPSRPSEVRAIALARLKMPRKSTRFMPKPALGLVCRPWTNSG